MASNCIITDELVITRFLNVLFLLRACRRRGDNCSECYKTNKAYYINTSQIVE